jgi:hypothetical protein
MYLGAIQIFYVLCILLSITSCSNKCKEQGHCKLGSNCDPKTGFCQGSCPEWGNFNHFDGSCTCIGNFKTGSCTECKGNFRPPECNECAEGFKGDSCDVCVGNYIGNNCDIPLGPTLEGIWADVYARNHSRSAQKTYWQNAVIVKFSPYNGSYEFMKIECRILKFEDHTLRAEYFDQTIVKLNPTGFETDVSRIMVSSNPNHILYYKGTFNTLKEDSIGKLNQQISIEQLSYNPNSGTFSTLPYGFSNFVLSKSNFESIYEPHYE